MLDTSVTTAQFATARQTLAGRAALERGRKHRPELEVSANSNLLKEAIWRDRVGEASAPLIYHFTYEDAEGRISTRIVTLRRIEPAPERMSLVCWCHTTESIRMFLADRVREVFCVVTGEVFDDPTTYFLQHPMLTAPKDPEAYALAVCRHEVNLLIMVGAADGLFDPGEQEKVLIHVYDRMPDLDLNDHVLGQRIAKLAPDEKAFDIALFRMSKFKDGDPVALMRSLRKLVDADGVIAPEETSFVNEIQTRLARRIADAQ